MAGQIAPRVIEGIAFKGGVAMSVTRHPGLVVICLTVMPGHPAASSAEGETVEVTFPEPVPVAAGERAAIPIAWGMGGTVDYAGPVLLPCAQVLTEAHVRR